MVQNVNWLIANKKGFFSRGENEGAWGYVYPKGLTITVEGGGGGVRGKIPALCTDCKISPEGDKYLKSIKYGQMSTHGYVELKKEKLRELRIINDAGDYVPFDANWIDQFPELKRITPLSKNYYDTTPTRSEKEFQEEIAKIKAAEPLQILNQVQHIEPEPVASETPIQEKSFIDKNKNYLIIGGIAITALILILAVRK